MALTMLPLCLATPAMAQISASASLASDYRFRGISLSDGRPALTANLAYDHSSGAYAGVSVIGIDTPHDGAQMLGHIEYIGYATRKSRGLSWDVGLHNEDLTAYADRKYVFRYTEVYAGLTSNNISTHLYYSPNYLKPGASILYADLDGALRPAPQWRLFGHVRRPSAPRISSPAAASATTFAPASPASSRAARWIWPGRRRPPPLSTKPCPAARA
jgi:uncharacterized protein (TIGR02001 family)